jgi:protein-L-isoaspartate(D-aspartate) O-methyltransferase
MAYLSGSFSAAGYEDVKVLCADAESEVEPGRPYDLIICTAGAWDIPPWIAQLGPGGTLVVPLRTMGMTRSWALRRSGNHLVSRGHVFCGFVPLQGAGASQGRSIPIGEGVSLWLDEAQGIDGRWLASVLSHSRAEVWSEVTVQAGTLCSELDCG